MSSPHPPSSAHSPSTQLLPPTFPTQLCPTCTSHLSLQTSLLAAYLPDPVASPGEYELALRGEEAYRQRLEDRYPLVCERCQDRVERELQRANYRGRTAALGAFLRPSRPSRARDGQEEQGSGAKEGWGWRVGWEVKRLLWVCSLGMAWIGLVESTFPPPPLLPLSQLNLLETRRRA